MKTIIKASTSMSKLFSYSILFILLTTACSSIPDKVTSHNLTHHPAFAYEKHTSENLIYHLTTIDLSDNTIKIEATEPIAGKNYETIGTKTKDFANNTGAFLAINTSPFSYPSSRLSNKRTIEGLYIYKGTLFSKPIEQYAALCFTKDNTAFITNSQSSSETQQAYFAFGGFWTILENEKIYQFKDIKDARTAVGISNDGKKIYILSVEKNQNSDGLNYMDCAKILKNAGAYKALQLDGGGSTSLIFSHSTTNSIISTRKVATNLGFTSNEQQ